MAKEKDNLKSGLEKVEGMIKWGRFTYPLASENLRHWRDGKGVEKVMPTSAFQNADFLIEHLRSAHRKKFLEGARRRLGDGTLVQGKKVDMEWTDSVNAPYFSDLFYALGGFTVHSKITVEAAVKEAGKSVDLRFTSWKVQVTDRYNWDPGKWTFVPVYGRVTDDEMLAIERAGYGREYRVRSDWFDLLDADATRAETARYSAPAAN